MAVDISVFIIRDQTLGYCPGSQLRANEGRCRRELHPCGPDLNGKFDGIENRPYGVPRQPDDEESKSLDAQLTAQGKSFQKLLLGNRSPANVFLDIFIGAFYTEID